MQISRESQNASVAKYKRVNCSVCGPSGYLSRFSEIIPGTLGCWLFHLSRGAAPFVRIDHMKMRLRNSVALSAQLSIPRVRDTSNLSCSFRWTERKSRCRLPNDPRRFIPVSQVPPDAHYTLQSYPPVIGFERRLRWSQFHLRECRHVVRPSKGKVRYKYILFENRSRECCNCKPRIVRRLPNTWTLRRWTGFFDEMDHRRWKRLVGNRLLSIRNCPVRDWTNLLGTWTSNMFETNRRTVSVRSAVERMDFGTCNFNARFLRFPGISEIFDLYFTSFLWFTF